MTLALPYHTITLALPSHTHPPSTHPCHALNRPCCAAGGLSIVTSTPGLRVDAQDWSELTLEAFPATATRAETKRVLHSRSPGAPRTFVSMATADGDNTVSVNISAAEDQESRAWVLRVHLKPGQRVVRVTSSPH